MTTTEPTVIEAAPHAGDKLSVAERRRTLVDMWGYYKTRKLVYIWTPFCLLFGGIGLYLEHNPFMVLGGIAYGIFLYSIIEYLMHRYLYHYEPENKLLRLITADVAREHMRHHRDPGYYGGAINGAQAPIVVFAAGLGLLSWATPYFPTGFGLIATAAGAANYVAQELVHFSAHHMPMQKGFIGMIQRHHMLHHYRDGNSNFGLFWTFWDYVLGTNYRPKSKRAKAA